MNRAAPSRLALGGHSVRSRDAVPGLRAFLHVAELSLPSTGRPSTPVFWLAAIASSVMKRWASASPRSTWPAAKHYPRSCTFHRVGIACAETDSTVGGQFGFDRRKQVFYPNPLCQATPKFVATESRFVRGHIRYPTA